jgi:hypothetical protein
MIETDYSIPPVPINCVCGSQICEEVYIRGITLLHAGGGMWHELRGHCAQCGAPFYWSVKSENIQLALKMQHSKRSQETDDAK